MRGVYTALVTPMDSRGAIDFTAYFKILDDQCEARVAGVIPSGTTGESPTLTTDEKKKLITETIRHLGDSPEGRRLRVIAGTGSNNTAETIALTRWAAEAGAGGALVVTPYYNKPTAAGLEAHFLATANAIPAASPCELMLYNVPGRTATSLTPSSIAALSRHAKIRSLKEATGNVAFTSEVRDALRVAGLAPESLDILSGDDATYLPLLSVGAVGVVSVASNLFPRAMVAILRHFENGELAEARALHDRFFPLFRDLFVESNPGPIKFAMHYANWSGCSTQLRAPLAGLTETSIARLRASLALCGVESGKRL